MYDDLANSQVDWAPKVLPALEPRDEALLQDEARYCPTRMLSAFALLMSGHGRPVCTSMMLGDREYAMAQLSRAHTLGDAGLRELAARLFEYFDDHRARPPVGLRP